MIYTFIYHSCISKQHCAFGWRRIWRYIFQSWKNLTITLIKDCVTASDSSITVKWAWAKVTVRFIFFTLAPMMIEIDRAHDNRLTGSRIRVVVSVMKRLWCLTTSIKVTISLLMQGNSS